MTAFLNPLHSQRRAGDLFMAVECKFFSSHSWAQEEKRDLSTSIAFLESSLRSDARQPLGLEILSPLSTRESACRSANEIHQPAFSYLFSSFLAPIAFFITV